MAFQDHFSGHAAAYQAARPTYPEALFDWLAAIVPQRQLAWDVACGNGQASLALASRFERVFASDPSVEQVAAAPTRPNIDYHVEPAEDCSLPDAGADLATVAQALHWFDHARFYAEARRVLRPGGVLAAWGYSDCRIEPAIDAIKDHLYLDLTGPYWPPERALLDAGYRTLAFPFEPIAAPQFDMMVSWNLGQFLGYLRSWSATERYRKATGVDPVALVEADLRGAWGDAAVERAVHWDFHLRVGRRER
jgi:SAM-dependent methyltransferase